MNVRILNPKRELYSGEAKSVFLPGDTGEFELQDFHAPIISLLKPGKVVIDWETVIPIKKGLAKFDRNECMLLVEES